MESRTMYMYNGMVYGVKVSEYGLIATQTAPIMRGEDKNDSYTISNET